MRLGDCGKTNLHTYSDKEKWSLIRYLDTGSITEGRIDEIQTLYPGVDKIPSRARRKASVGDILFSTVRPNQKHYGIIEAGTENLLVSTGFTVVTVDTTIADPYFIYYYLTQSSVIESLQAIAEQSTSTYPSIKPSDIEDIELDLPELETQKKIGSTLRMLDRKIALNEEINDNLEQQARLLYDYWFTQFDFPDENGEPYRSSGGKMVWNEQLKRTIPDGWTTNHLSDIFTFKSGYSFSSDLYEVSGKYKLLTIKNVQNNGINLNVDNYINVLPDNVPDYCLLKAKDILMSLTGNVGRVGIMYADNCLLNQRVALAEPVNINQQVFVYFLLKSDIIHKQYEMIANGSSQQNLSPIEAEKVIIAYNPEVATKFSTLCNEYLNTIVSNLAENQELINIRDWLLPMLMNGQATIND